MAISRKPSCISHDLGYFSYIHQLPQTVCLKATWRKVTRNNAKAEKVSELLSEILPLLLNVINWSSTDQNQRVFNSHSEVSGNHPLSCQGKKRSVCQRGKLASLNSKLLWKKRKGYEREEVVDGSNAGIPWQSDISVPRQGATSSTPLVMWQVIYTLMVNI